MRYLLQRRKLLFLIMLSQETKVHFGTRLVQGWDQSKLFSAISWCWQHGILAGAVYASGESGQSQLCCYQGDFSVTTSLRCQSAPCPGPRHISQCSGHHNWISSQNISKAYHLALHLPTTPWLKVTGMLEKYKSSTYSELAWFDKGL